MADQSFQDEKPPTRIDIKVKVDSKNAQPKEELPLRMMVLGDFGGKSAEAPLADRKPDSINKDNFDGVMKSSNLELNLTVPDTYQGGNAETKVQLKFDSMKSFEPQEVVKQVPRLNELMEKRNLLLELKNRVISDPEFRKEIERIIKDPAELEKFAKELGL